jgi:hypothetical protein
MKRKGSASSAADYVFGISSSSINEQGKSVGIILFIGGLEERKRPSSSNPIEPVLVHWG